jgi:methylated-DNA-[protein]-cysteine S-methyltransferase
MSTALPFPCVSLSLIDSPLDPLRAAWTDRGLAALWMQAQRHGPTDALVAALPLGRPLSPAAQAWDTRLRDWLSRYFRGEAVEFAQAGLPLDLHGTDFQRRVWAALQVLPWGRSSTYGEIAASLGQPRASRAVGAAVGRNPVSILVPCHRILGRDGSLTGYAGGLERKRHLLGLEGLLAPCPPRRGDLSTMEPA